MKWATHGWRDFDEAKKAVEFKPVAFDAIIGPLMLCSGIILLSFLAFFVERGVDLGVQLVPYLRHKWKTFSFKKRFRELRKKRMITPPNIVAKTHVSMIRRQSKAIVQCQFVVRSSDPLDW